MKWWLIVVAFLFCCCISEQAKRGGRKRGRASDNPSGKTGGTECGAVEATAEEVVEAGNRYFAIPDYDIAERCYLRALDLNPRHVVAITNLGLVYVQRQQFDKALPILDKATEADPTYAYAYFGLGAAYTGSANWDEAIDAFEHCLELDPKQVVAINPLSEAYLRKSMVIRDQGNYPVAREFAEKAVEINPQNFQTHKNLGVILRHVGLHQQGVESMERAARLNDKDPELLANLGFAYGHLGRNKEAIETLKAALNLAPHEAGIYIALARTMEHLDHFVPEAIELYRKVLSLPKKSEWSQSHMDAHLGLLRLHGDTCDWRDRSAEMQAVMIDSRWQLDQRVRPILTPFDTMLFEYPDELTHKLARSYAELGARELRGWGVREAFSSWPSKASAAPVRIGYVSPDLGTNPVGRLVASVPRFHSSKVEVYIYALNPDDGSAWRRRVEEGAAKVRLMDTTSNAQAVETIREDRIDVLVDLMGYTAKHFAIVHDCIFIAKPAPIAINMVGYPGTLGMGQVEYVVTDRIITPPELQDHFTEKPLYVPYTYQVNDMATGAAYMLSEDFSPPSREEFDLPSDAFVYASFNTLRKIDPVVLEAWANILSRVPSSVLWLLRMPSKAEANIKSEMVAKGVSPDRVIFTRPLPHEQHVARCALADVFLDTFNYNAHTTATDALWAGVPVITLAAGDKMQSRVAASLAVAAGTPDTVISSVEEYVDFSVRVGENPYLAMYLRSEAERLRHSSPMFDTQQWVRDFEARVLRVWRRYKKGKKPRATQ